MTELCERMYVEQPKIFNILPFTLNMFPLTPDLEPV